MENQIFTGLSARDYARVLFRHKGILLLITLVALAVTTLYSYLVLPTYEGEAKVLIVAQRDTPMPMAEKLTPLRPGIEVAYGQGEVMKSNAIVSEVVKALDLEHRADPPGLKGAIKVKWDNFCEWIGDVKQAIKDQIIALFTGKQPAARRKATKFEKQVNHLRSKKVVHVDPMERTDIIVIKTRDYDPEMAAQLANAFAHSYILYNMETQIQDLARLFRADHPRMRQIQTEIEAQRELLNSRSLEPIENLAGKTSSGEIKLLQSAVIPNGAVAPKKIINLAIALVLSLVVGIGYVFLLELMDQSLKAPQDVQDSLKTRILGSIPLIPLKKEVRMMPLTANALNGKSGDFNAAMSSIASELILMKKHKNIKTILIVSAGREDGRTTLAVNLAATLSKVMHQRVLLIDGDLRNPKIQRVMGTGSKPGISSLMEGSSSLKDVVNQNNERNISYISAGKELSHPEVFFSSPGVTNLLKEAKEQYDFILIDTPNMRVYKDALGLSGQVDGAIFIVNTYNTRKHLAQMYGNMLTERSIPVIGAVLNFREFVIPEAIYKKI